MRKTDLLTLTPAELAAYITGLGEPAYRARQVLAWLWPKDAASFMAMTNLPLALRERLERQAVIGGLSVAAREKSADGTENAVYAAFADKLLKLLFYPTESETVHVFPHKSAVGWAAAFVPPVSLDLYAT